MNQEKPRKEDRPISGGLNVIDPEQQQSPAVTPIETETETTEESSDAGES